MFFSSFQGAFIYGLNHFIFQVHMTLLKNSFKDLTWSKNKQLMVYYFVYFNKTCFIKQCVQSPQRVLDSKIICFYYKLKSKYLWDSR